jgi:hypothetical protein
MRARELSAWSYAARPMPMPRRGSGRVRLKVFITPRKPRRDSYAASPPSRFAAGTRTSSSAKLAVS